ncbi:hypothetical protein GCM10029992_13260 [Glycomyces albus]
MAIDNYRTVSEPVSADMSGLAKASMDWRRLAHNVETLAGLTSAPLMAMVKADAYGHGVVPTARVAVEAGAARLGVATLREAWRLARMPELADVPVLGFVYAPDQPGLAETIAAGAEIGITSRAQLDAVAAAADHGGPESTSRRTPGSPAAASPSTNGRPTARPPPSTRPPDASRSSAPGATWPAPMRPATPPTRCRRPHSNGSSAPSPPPESNRRSGTWPTRRPSSPTPRPTTTWSAPASRSTATTPSRITRWISDR